jgi:anaerobic selenocysteine-containing dehydrogenase
VFLNEEDIDSLGLKNGTRADLISRYNGEERVARNFTVVSYSIPRRCAATYFPEANVLVPVSYFADKSHTPASKSVVISIRRSDETSHHEDTKTQRENL